MWHEILFSLLDEIRTHKNEHARIKRKFEEKVRRIEVV